MTSADLDEPGPLIEYVNAGFTHMTGYEASEVIGRSPRMLQGPRTSRALLDDVRLALSDGSPFHGETVNYHKDGSTYVVNWIIKAIRGSEGRITNWISVQSDVTERARLEAGLMIRNERFRIIIENVLDYAIFICDEHDTITDWWPGAAAVYGWTAQEAVGRPASITFTAEDRSAGIPAQETEGAARDGIMPNVRWHRHAAGHLVFIAGSVRAIRNADGNLIGFLKIGQDVTARRAADERLRDSEKRLARAILAARMSTWEWDTTKDILHFSAGMEALYGRREGSMPSLNAVLEAIHPDDRSVTELAIELALRPKMGGDLAAEFRVLLPDGGIRWLLISGRAEPSADGTSTRLAGVTQDVTARHEAEARIVYMARHDGLTGVLNWAAFQEHLVIALLHSKRGTGCAVLSIDLDNFKDVNDSSGHAAGDALLRSVASRLRDSIRAVDVLARLGGDEFIVIQSNLQTPRDAERLAARIIAEIGLPHDIDGKQLVTAASIGIALAPEDATDAEQLLKNADLALYDAKRRTGRGYSFFEPAMQAKAENRRQLDFDLRQAIAKGEFELHYQPLVGLAEYDIVGFEALVRWRHPVRGLVAPNEFIGAAEESGLIVPFGAWALSAACSEAARWPSPYRVAVNLSARQFLSDDLPDTVTAALTASGLAPARLELEITESLLLQDAEETLVILHRLRAQGVTICMDDFGTGYSSLSYFLKFPFGRMKIDRSFVAIALEPQGAAIIRAAVDLCRSFGIPVVAEGIETAEQLQQVISLGCSEGQGFLFARPVPAADITGMLTGWIAADR